MPSPLRLRVCALAASLLAAAACRVPSPRQAAAPRAGPGPAATLRDELLAMKAVDQAARNSLMAAPDDAAMAGKVREIDLANTARLKQIVAERGWPGKKVVGNDGAEAAWLLIQHADHDVVFQRSCLELLEKAAAAGEAEKSAVAYLTDRVLLTEGKKQLYGTQFIKVGDSWEPRPIEDEAGLDARRAAMGLSTMPEYRKTLIQAYPAPASASDASVKPQTP